MTDDIKDLFMELILPIGALCLVCLLVFGIPTYYLFKSECTTFAELQNTPHKFTMNGTCYLMLDGEWIDKDRWYFYKAFTR